MPYRPIPADVLFGIVRHTRADLAFAKARILDDLLEQLQALADWQPDPQPEAAPIPAPTLDADEARATVAAPAPEPAPEPTAPRKVTRRAKVDAEPEAEPTSAPSRIRAPKAAQVQVAMPAPEEPAPVLAIAQADDDGPF